MTVAPSSTPVRVTVKVSGSSPSESSSVAIVAVATVVFGAMVAVTVVVE